MKRTLVIAAILAACTETSVTDLRVQLQSDGLSCVTSPFTTVNSITVAGIGEVNGARCLLASRCVPANARTSVAMVDQDLIAATQPLLDVEASRLVEIRIEGHATASCPATRTMCGAASVTAAVDGVLAIGMTCDSVVFADQCSNEALATCP